MGNPGPGSPLGSGGLLRARCIQGAEADRAAHGALQRVERGRHFVRELQAALLGAAQRPLRHDQRADVRLARPPGVLEPGVLAPPAGEQLGFDARQAGLRGLQPPMRGAHLLDHGAPEPRELVADLGAAVAGPIAVALRRVEDRHRGPHPGADRLLAVLVLLRIHSDEHAVPGHARRQLLLVLACAQLGLERHDLRAGRERLLEARALVRRRRGRGRPRVEVPVGRAGRLADPPGQRQPRQPQLAPGLVQLEGELDALRAGGRGRRPGGVDEPVVGEQSSLEHAHALLEQLALGVRALHVGHHVERRRQRGRRLGQQPMAGHARPLRSLHDGHQVLGEAGLELGHAAARRPAQHEAQDRVRQPAREVRVLLGDAHPRQGALQLGARLDRALHGQRLAQAAGVERLVEHAGLQVEHDGLLEADHVADVAARVGGGRGDHAARCAQQHEDEEGNGSGGQRSRKGTFPRRRRRPSAGCRRLRDNGRLDSGCAGRAGRRIRSARGRVGDAPGERTAPVFTLERFVGVGHGIPRRREQFARRGGSPRPQRAAPRQARRRDTRT